MKFSFIISAYNEENLIGMTLDVLLKTVKKYKTDYEILVGVDGTDKTADIARSYAKRFSKITVHHFKERGGKTKVLNYFIARAKGDILVNHDADRIFIGNTRDIEKVFRDKKVGGIVFIDPGDRDSLNEGQMIFEHTYDELKIKRHSIGKEVQHPILGCYIFRKAALGNDLKIETISDEFETVDKFLSNGYKFVYSKKVATPMLDNPLMDRLTPSGIIRRRKRAELIRLRSKQIFKQYSFSPYTRFYEALLAFFLTARRTTLKEFLEVLVYLSIVSIAIVNARVRALIRADLSNLGLWKIRVR